MNQYTTELDDGSLLIEWIGTDKRFGIYIQKNPLDSTWYYVSSDHMDEGSGYLPEQLLERLRKE